MNIVIPYANRTLLVYQLSLAHSSVLVNSSIRLNFVRGLHYTLDSTNYMTLRTE